jgi:hypothetical protein
MAVRTQILLDPEDHRRAKRHAADLGISLAEYLRRLIARDLGEQEPQADVSAIFDLGKSGTPSDIAAHKDEYIGQAITEDWQRGLRRR